MQTIENKSGTDWIAFDLNRVDEKCESQDSRLTTKSDIETPTMLGYSIDKDVRLSRAAV